MQQDYYTQSKKERKAGLQSNIKCMWSIALAVDIPHLEVYFLQVPNPLCSVKQGATQSDILQSLPQAQALVVIQPKLDSFLFILLHQQD